MRRHLPWFAAVWLACQLAALAAAPVALGTTQLSVDASKLCECPGAQPGASCPMHPHGAKSKQHTPATPDSRIESTCPPTAAALLALMGGLGLLVAPPDAVAHLTVAEQIVLPSVSASSHPALPDSPPPRS